MKKFNALYVSAFVAVIFISSCSSSDQKSEQSQEETPVVEEQSQTPEKQSQLLNANWATEEELTAIEGMTTELTKKVIEARPLANISDLNQVLSVSLSDSAISEVYKNVFVPLNLNRASEENIKMIPGVGDKMAHEFEEYRPYAKMAQFKREIGKYVDDNEVERLAMYVYVPVDLNSATDEEFLSIPGVGDKMLHEFKEYRPYNSMEQFRREIGKYVSEDVVAMYERYVMLAE